MILVLAPDCTDELLDDVVRKVERLGFRAEVSRGSEQTVVALEGSGEAAGVEAALSGVADIDVIPVLSHNEYRMKRTRRFVLTGLATGFGVLTAAGGALPVVGFLLPPRGTLADPDVALAGSAASLETGAARTVLLRGKPVLLICLEPGRYAALGAICTHMGTCRVDWDRDRRLLVCPCHGGAFDVHGNVVRGPASIPLPAYTVERVGEELYVSRT